MRYDGSSKCHVCTVPTAVKPNGFYWSMGLYGNDQNIFASYTPCLVYIDDDGKIYIHSGRTNAASTPAGNVNVVLEISWYTT